MNDKPNRYICKCGAIVEEHPGHCDEGYDLDIINVGSLDINGNVYRMYCQPCARALESEGHTVIRGKWVMNKPGQ